MDKSDQIDLLNLPDPTPYFSLLELLGEGSYGAVYKVLLGLTFTARALTCSHGSLFRASTTAQRKLSRSRLSSSSWRN